MQTVAQLTTAPSADTIFAQMITGLVNLGIPADKWRKGGVGRSILYTVATSFATLAALITLVASSAFLDTATGDWLTLLAAKVYGVTRVLPTFASGNILVSNSSGSIFIMPPGSLVVQDSVTLQFYTNTQSVTVNPLQQNVQVAVQCTVQGTVGNANPGEVTIVSSGQSGLTCTNPSSIVGIDQQTDPSLRALCLAKLGALSMMGPRGAYAYAIGSAINAGGSPVNVNRYSITPASSTGQVQIYLASPSGAAAAGDVTAVQQNLEGIARPDSVTVAVASAVVATFSPSFTVWVRGTAGAPVTSSAALQGSPTVSASSSGNTYTRSSGGSFINDGFLPGQTVQVSGFSNGPNNGPKTVIAVTASTLTVAQTLVTEANVVGINIASLAVTLAGIDAAAIQTLCQNALTNYIATYPIGGNTKPPSTQGYLYDESIRAVVQSAHPAIFAVDTAAPTDFALSAGQVAVLNPTFTVRLVAAGATS